jgi:hypothetical protein
MFRCRLWTRCLFTFTKLATSQSRCGVSSSDKASTTSRSELIPKRVKPCTASSLAVTVSSSAADRRGLPSAPAARIRTDLRCRTSPVTTFARCAPCSRLFPGLITDSRRLLSCKTEKAAEASLRPGGFSLMISAFRFRTFRANRVLAHRSLLWWRALDRLGRL